jgi:hypothetical protein
VSGNQNARRIWAGSRKDKKNKKPKGHLKMIKKKHERTFKKNSLVHGLVEVAFVVGFPGYPYFF